MITEYLWKATIIIILIIILTTAVPPAAVVEIRSRTRTIGLNNLISGSVTCNVNLFGFLSK